MGASAYGSFFYLFALSLQDTTILGGTTFSWPLWFHTALPGNISLYISIYYEMESCSSDMMYRTLRMHYDVEVRLCSVESQLIALEKKHEFMAVFYISACKYAISHVCNR